MKQKINRKEQSAKRKELLVKNMKQRAAGIKLHALCSVLYALCLMLFVLMGCTPVIISPVKEPLETKEIRETPVITSIDIQDYAVSIAVNKPFIYTIYRPGDPYKIVIDIPDVDIGAFSNRIVSDKAGITEIIPSRIESPSFMTRLEMLLQTPSVVEQEYKNNVLIVKIKEEPFKEVSKEELLPAKEGQPKEIPEPSATGQKQSPGAKEISGISFEESADGVNVLIRGNGSMIPNVLPLDDSIVIDIPGAIINTPLPSAVISPVKGIRSEKYDDKTRLILDLKEKTNFDVSAAGDVIVIALSPPTTQTPVEKTAAKEAKKPEMLIEDRCRAYLDGRENINFDFQDQDIVPIFRLFADISGCNLFLHPDVRGRCTMKFKDVPWNQALDTILKTFSLGKSVEGNIIRIAPHAVFAKESEDAAKAMEAGIKAEPLAIRIFPINYAKVKDVETAVKNSKILTPRGSSSVDERTSTMLIKDAASVFPEVENLLATLDKPTPQVLIEARIVEIATNEVKDLGIQWGFFANSANSLTSVGGYSGLNTGELTGESYIVDFPGGAGQGSGSGFSFGILNPAKTLGLDIRLNAVEEAGKGKIISNPRIMTIDNEEATISQGASIPYRMQTAEGTVSEGFKDYTLNLKVKPHIAPDNSVALAIETKKEEPDYTRVSALGTPSSKKAEAKTNVIIKNGETVVIGGILKTNRNESSAGVPGLKNIPILRWLFGKERTTEDSGELLIFITPRIVTQ